MKRLVLLLAGTGILWTFCSDYNPFENSSNVTMVIQTSTTTLVPDTTNNIYIFTTETLTVAAAVKEQIDSVTVTAEGNRYWNNKTFKAPISSSDIMLLFSYPDTGQRTITLNTYRKNNDVIPLEFSLTVTSPLQQNDVSGGENDTINLSTVSVGDMDVLYTWKFDGGVVNTKIIPSSLPSYVYSIDIIGTGTGSLWVSDTMGNVSPTSMFSYNFFDTTGPVILSFNEGLSGDTVVTGAKSFIFKIECYDGSGVGGALINDSLLFTDSIVNIKSTVYYKLFTGMDSLTAPMSAVVRAWDKEGNSSSHSFFIRYDVNGPKEVIFLKYPPQNPYITNQDSYNIIATIFNPVSDSVLVTVEHIEQGIVLNLDTLAENAEVDITYSASLLPQSNTLVISVLQKDSLTNILAKDTVAITYTTGTVEDVSPPYINSITINGNEGKAHFVAGDSATLALEAFDEHMDSVVINGVVTAEVSKFFWKATMALTGEMQYFIIHITDSSGNYTNDTVRVQRNYLPVIDPPATWPKTLVIGQKWSASFRVMDEDGDQVNVTHEPVPGSTLPGSGAITFTQHTQLNRTWVVSWSGSSTSVVNQIVPKDYVTEVVLSDSKQNNKYRWDFTIKDSSQVSSYVFKMLLPDNIDTTDDGDLDLSMINKQVTVKCLLIAEAKQFAESDTITIQQPDQTVKFGADAVDTNEFSLAFNPVEKKENEIMIITIIDSSGTETVVDTVTIVYFYDFPKEIDSLGWLLQTDTGIKVEEGRVEEWYSTYGNALKLTDNEYTDDLYDMETTPRYIEDGIQGLPVLRFDPAEHSNLINQGEHWIHGPFSLFFVVKQTVSDDVVQDTGNVLLSSGANRYIGLGVFDGKMGIIGQTSGQGEIRDTIITCDMKVTKEHWHILCYISENGVGESSAFDLAMLVDGYACTNNAIVLPNGITVSDASKYLTLGSGAKHYAVKTWRGDMAEVVKYRQFLNEDERDQVFRYLASKFKIQLRK